MWVMPGIDHDSLGGHPDYENRITKFLDEVDKSRLVAQKGAPKKK